MTGMEQGLRYIEREIRFMVKDQFGNPTYAKYADRVVEDATGVPNFCSTVLSSKRPLTVILRVVRGTKGDAIVRFFNVALHDSRIELVMVLAEATKLRSRREKSSQEAHAYLMKLYKKAIKKTVRLVTGSKDKNSYKSTYQNLRKFAGMDDFSLDDDDDDYFDDEFGDTDYAEKCLKAYRDGDIPPEPALSYSSSTKLQGNEDILKEIAAIELKLGRPLTDSELDRFLCGDDDDEPEDYGEVSKTKVDMESVSDKLAELVFAKVMEKLGGNTPKVQDPGFESLDDFLAKQDSQDQKAQNPPLINDVSSSEKSVEAEEGTTEKTEEDSDDDDDSSLPPNDELGGNTSNVESEDDADADEVITEEFTEILSTDSLELKTDRESIVNNEDSAVAVSEGFFDECIPHMNHALQLSEIIRDFTKNVIDENTQLIQKLSNYFNQLVTVGLTDIEVVMSPSVKKNKLLQLTVNIRVSGDSEIINRVHLNTVVLIHAKNLAKLLGIPESMIDTKVRMSISDTKFSGLYMQDVNNALSVLKMYIYHRLGNIANLRAYLDASTQQLYVSFLTDGDYPIESFLVYADENTEVTKTFKEFFDAELIGEGILDEIFDAFYVSEKHYEINYTFEELSEYLDKLNAAIKSNEATLSFIRGDLAIDFTQAMYNSLEFFDDAADITFDNISQSIGQTTVGIDLVYTVHLKKALSSTEKKSFESEISSESNYQFGIEDLLHSISNDIEVSTYIRYSIDNEEETETEMTGNFGI